MSIGVTLLEIQKAEEAVSRWRQDKPFERTSLLPVIKALNTASADWRLAVKYGVTDALRQVGGGTAPESVLRERLHRIKGILARVHAQANDRINEAELALLDFMPQWLRISRIHAQQAAERPGPRKTWEEAEQQKLAAH